MARTAARKATPAPISSTHQAGAVVAGGLASDPRNVVVGFSCGRSCCGLRGTAAWREDIACSPCRRRKEVAREALRAARITSRWCGADAAPGGRPVLAGQTEPRRVGLRPHHAELMGRPTRRRPVLVPR